MTDISFRRSGRLVVIAGLMLLVTCGRTEKTAPEEVTEEKPRDVRALANAAYKNKAYGECDELYVESANRAPGEIAVSDLYNAACCAALAGNHDKALKHLAAAVDRGYRDATHMTSDSDLDSLHGDPRWPKLVVAIEAKEKAFIKSVNAELAQIYKDDQADRSGTHDKVDWSVISKRDEGRRKRVLEILAAGDLKSSADYLHAAMVFQHGHTEEDFQRAHELAVRAVELDALNDTAKWLAAAAKDRYLMQTGKPQLYGTQFRKSENGRWELYEVDSSITDQERATWNVPPIAEAKKRVAEMNEDL